MRKLIVTFLLSLLAVSAIAASASAESLAVPLSIYGGCAAADIIVTRQSNGPEIGVLRLVGKDLAAQVAIKAVEVTAQTWLDQKVLGSRPKARWFVRGAFVGLSLLADKITHDRGRRPTH